MDMFVVRGGRPLAGSIGVSGSKNAALPILAAGLAVNGRMQFSNVPDLVDVRTLSQLLASLGAEIFRRDDGIVEMEVREDHSVTADYQLVRRMRASVCVLGPLLARRGRACVSLPGGCNIGNRPIDLHLKGLAALGAEIEVRGGYVHASAAELRGANIYLAGPQGSTVTGTCNILTAAALARGTTIIEAAACEPEVVALAEFLISTGAQIHGHGTSRIVIDGVNELRGTSFEVMPDRIEAATLLMGAAITRGSMTLTNAIPGHLSAVLETLRQMGGRLTVSGAATSEAALQPQQIHFSSPQEFQPVDISARPYPGIPTDVQAQLMALASTIPGTTLIRDYVFPDRMMHVAELARMGACIRQQASTAIVTGVPQFSGAAVMASDLRASAALVLAGLAADGETTIRRIYHLDRGYEQLEQKLTQLGADVQRLKDQDGLHIAPATTLPVIPQTQDRPWRKSA